jgi:SOS-response transcriptional repressor LexA
MPPADCIVNEGDVAIVNPSQPYDTGNLVAAHGPARILVRMASLREGGKVDLIAAQPLYGKVTVEAKQIIGPVVLVIRRMRR